MYLRYFCSILFIFFLQLIAFGEVVSLTSETGTVMFSLNEMVSINDSVLRADSSSTKGLFNNYLISKSKHLIIPGGKVCVVEFDYEIIQKAEVAQDHGYFYFFIRTPKSTEFDKWIRWEGESASKGHKRYTIELPDQPDWKIYFGIKGQGIIQIENLTISDFPDMYAAKSSVIFKPVKIGFEKDEPVLWKITGELAEVKTDDSGRHLLVNTTDAKGVWRNYMIILRDTLSLDNNSTYSIQFSYEVEKSSGYFYLFTTSRDGKRFPLRWNAAAGQQGKAQTIFTTGEYPPSRLTFGMRGAGIISIDDIVVKKWESEKEAEEGLLAEKISPDKLRTQLLQATKHVKKLNSVLKNLHMDAKIFRLNNLLLKDSFTVHEKLTIKRLMLELERDIFKLQVLNYCQSTSPLSPFLTFIDHSLIKIRRDASYNYAGKSTNSVELFCAGNERESFQLVVIPLLNDVEALSLIFSDLKSPNGVIDKTNITWHKVEYVNTSKELYPVEYVGWWPDPLVPEDKVNIPASQYVQPLWITLYVPADVPKGQYTGMLTIQVPNEASQKVSLTVNVRGFSLPKKATLKTSFAARSTADYYLKKGILQKGDPQLVCMNQMYRDALLDHRLSPARIANVKPRLIRKANGDYYVDFSSFDPKLTHYLAKGINCFTFGGYWGWRMKKEQKFAVWSEDADKSETVTLEVLSPQYNKLMGDYFKSWSKYLDSRGCLDDVYCYIYDEPDTNENEFVEKLMNVLHTASPQLKTIIPGIPSKGNTREEFPYLDIMCPLTAGIDFELACELQAEGKKSWWYVCLSPKHPYPNFFIDYPAIDHRILFWMSWKYDIEGFLYWQTTYWNRVNPWEDSETFSTVHGDGCLFYPSRKTPIEVIPSIRLANIRDGIEDYEYFAILKRTLARIYKNDVKVDQNLIDKAEKLLLVPEEIAASTSLYTKSPEKLFERRNRIGNMIDQLNIYTKKGK